MGVKPVQVKSILQKSNLPGGGYVLNPYTGCVHGCVYCYARFMKRFTAHPEPWGTFLDAKMNAPEMLKKQLARRRTPFRGDVFLSSVTDPYQAPEKKYQLTRSLLEILLEYQVPISILTKSDLVLRDADLFRQFKQCSVGLSIMTVDDEAARYLEPRATPPTRRLQALRSLRAQGISTWAFISPYIPGISDIRRLIQELTGAVDEIDVEAINTRGGNWKGVDEVLSRHYPELLETSRTLSRDAAYWRDLETQARQLAARAKVRMSGFYRH